MKYFLTFGGPTIGYRNRVNQVTNDIKKFNIFDNIFGFNDDILKQDKIFWQKHGHFLESNRRGYGYWLWKSYLVNKIINKMNDGDILLYCDTGCEFNINGKNRLEEYLEIVKNSESGILTFYLKYPEYEWTKNDLFENLNCSDEIKNSKQNMATIFFIKKCANSVEFLKKWYETCCNYNLINDSPSISSNHPEFKEHRHDQSVLSCLCKIYNSEKISDETWFYPNWEVDGAKYPIWAKRNRG